MSQYEGWKNWETWNVALWIQNDEGLYNMAREYARDGRNYNDLAGLLLEFSKGTMDDVGWKDIELDHSELDDMMKGLNDD